MGREEKKTVEYYPHYIGDGKKMFTIQHKYQNDGYATWNKLIELLAKTENHFLDLGEKSELMFVASYCLVSEELLLQIVQDICDLDEFDKILWSNKIIWCQKFVDSIQYAYSKRKNPCITREQLINQLSKKGRLEVVNEAPKAKKSTQSKEESIENPSTAIVRFDFKKALLDAGATPESVHIWLEIRKKKRSTNSEIAFNALVREAEKANMTIQECILKCAERSWAGFEARFMESTINKQVNGTNTAENREEALRSFGA